MYDASSLSRKAITCASSTGWAIRPSGIDESLDRLGLRASIGVSTAPGATTRLGDVEIAEGDKVIMFYVSGNWDERVFDHPEQLDLTRAPNRHLAFGGAGPHFCIGSNLAKATLRSILRELLTRLPDIEAGEPRYLASCIVQGIVQMPCTFTAP